MAKIVISRETKTKLLTAAANGQTVEPLMFLFTRSDRDFQAELVRTAEDAKNTAFLESLREFIAEQEREYWQLYGIAAEQQSLKDAAQPKRQSRADRRKQQRQQPAPLKITRSPNYNPTGISFVEFLKQRGLYYPPTYRPPFAHFVSGGAVNSNRRRH